MATRTSRDQSGYVGRGTATSPTEPLRPAVAEGWFPLDPAAAGIHRGLEVAGLPVMELPFVSRYRKCFETTWSDDAPVDSVRFVVLDCETTGLNPFYDRIVTIGAVAVRDGEILLEDSYEAMLKLTRHTGAVTVHGVTRDETRRGMEEQDALEMFVDYLKDGVIVGHHIGHDIASLDVACERHWGFHLSNRSVDTMHLAQHLQAAGAFSGRPEVKE